MISMHGLDLSGIKGNSAAGSTDHKPAPAINDKMLDYLASTIVSTLRQRWNVSSVSSEDVDTVAKMLGALQPEKVEICERDFVGCGARCLDCTRPPRDEKTQGTV